ncbi:MAG: efflux RND transporter periplasmic adaptor subunit [Anaerolineae bacterium]|nr:efflux RND transporter periplasmic adaptor subunit [Anaerolineae bacterium]
MKSWLFLISILAIALTTACGANNPLNLFATPTPTATATRPPTPTPQATATPLVSLQPTRTLKTRLVGNLVAERQASLAFAMTGRVKSVPVSEGTKVKAGDLLAALDTTTLELQLAQAKAALDIAQANWKRTMQGSTPEDILIAKVNVERAKIAVDQARAAYDRIGGDSNPFIATTTQALNLNQAIAAYQGAVAQYNLVVTRPTQAEQETSAASLAQAQAAYELARQNLNNARIVAPFDGTVVSIVPKVGEAAVANTPVITLADLSRMQVQVNVDETTLSTLRVGQTATITVDTFPNKVLSGRVKKIGLLGTATTNIVSVPIWIDLDPTDVLLFPGLSATVEIEIK